MIRVLIVDDDKLARMGLLSMLPWEKHDMQVVGGAANGAKAMEFLAANAVDLCFVDLMMPVMSGLDFIRAAMADHPSLQFVVLTFHEDFNFVQSALRMGVLDYISKLELEHADYDQMMLRLTAKLRRPETEITEGALPEWRDELCQRRWLYDEVALEALGARMLSQPGAASGVERLLVRAAMQIEDDTRMPVPPVPQIHSTEQAIGYLRQLRAAMLDAARDSQDLSQLPICLLKAVCMVREDIGQKLHADLAAARVGLSRAYFSTSFSREVGIPYNAFVRRERVRAACGLLRDQLGVRDVAARVGYEDMRSFAKLFCEQVGETPAAYRQRVAKGANVRSK